MEMIKRDTAYWIAFVWYMIGGLFGVGFWRTIVSGLVVSVLFNAFSTKITFKDNNIENDTNENETNEKGEN